MLYCSPLTVTDGTAPGPPSRPVTNTVPCSPTLGLTITPAPTAFSACVIRCARCCGVSWPGVGGRWPTLVAYGAECGTYSSSLGCGRSFRTESVVIGRG